MSATSSGIAAPAKLSRGLLLLVGVVSLVAGLLAIFYPGPSLLVIAIITGINLVVIGIVGLVDVVVDEAPERTSKGMAALVCALALIAGLIVLRRPDESVLALVLVLGIWLVISGVLGLATANYRDPGWAVRVVGALCELALGVVVLALPDVSVKTLAVLVGIGFAIRGLSLIVEGLRLGKAGAPA